MHRQQIFSRHTSAIHIATKTPQQVEITGHHRHPLGVERALVGVLKEGHQVGLGRFLQRHHGMSLPTPDISEPVLRGFRRDFSDQTGERQFSNQ